MCVRARMCVCCRNVYFMLINKSTKLTLAETVTKTGIAIVLKVLTHKTVKDYTTNA